MLLSLPEDLLSPLVYVSTPSPFFRSRRGRYRPSVAMSRAIIEGGRPFRTTLTLLLALRSPVADLDLFSFLVFSIHSLKNQ